MKLRVYLASFWKLFILRMNEEKLGATKNSLGLVFRGLAQDLSDILPNWKTSWLDSILHGMVCDKKKKKKMMLFLHVYSMLKTVRSSRTRLLMYRTIQSVSLLFTDYKT